VRGQPSSLKRVASKSDGTGGMLEPEDDELKLVSEVEDASLRDQVARVLAEQVVNIDLSQV